MSRDTWATTMFGVYLDREDIEKTFPNADLEDAAELEEDIKAETGLDACTHMVDGYVSGVGIGFHIEDKLKGDKLIAGIQSTSEKLTKLKTKLKTKPMVITMENDDGG